MNSNVKKKKKSLLIVACILLLAAAAVFCTVAYLTAKTDTVKNTFTVGDVNLTLDEAKVDADGQAITGDKAERVLGNSYKLIPGKTYDKDPTVHVAKGSEKCYVRMVVRIANVDKLKAAIPYSTANDDYYIGGYEYTDNGRVWVNNQDSCFKFTKLLGGMDANKWINCGATDVKPKKDSATTHEFYEFRYYTTVDASAATADIDLEPLFKTITLPGIVDADGLKGLADMDIQIYAQAIQAEGFASADDAWDTLPIELY